MPWKGNDFQHTRGEAYSALTYDKYGEEHDTTLDGLVDVENGSRKYWADQLRKVVENDRAYRPKWAAAMREAAALLDPYSGEDGPDGEFARTTLSDDPEGEKRVLPNLD